MNCVSCYPDCQRALCWTI